MTEREPHHAAILEAAAALRQAGVFLGRADDAMIRLTMGYDGRETALMMACHAIEALELAKKALQRISLYQSYSPES